jgi:DNA-directed RNA polymerase specialized sigma24 family protein
VVKGSAEVEGAGAVGVAEAVCGANAVSGANAVCGANAVSGAADGEEALLALWGRARQIALRRCRRTLARLRAGAGGFYGADDLEQDLFLGFWALARALPEEELWPAWERALWGGGLRYLQRAPQRLWARAERQMPPGALDLDDGEPQVAALGGARRGLVQEEDSWARLAALAELDALEEGLWRLRPAQRQILYLAVLRGLPAAEVARRLALADGRAVHARTFRARAALRRALGRGQRPSPRRG